MVFRVTFAGFCLSLLFLTLFVAFSGAGAATLWAIGLLYVLGSLSVFGICYLCHKAAAVSLKIAFPAAVLLGFLYLAGILAWYSGSTFPEVLEVMLFKRSHYIALTDAFLAGNLAGYILMLRKVGSPGTELEFAL